MKHIKNSWMTISSVKISHPAECNCHLLYRMTSESYLMSSLPLLHLYISQCKFHISCLIPRSSSTCTACTTMYCRFFNVWNKLLKCTYVHLSLFHSNVSNIPHGVRIEAVFASLQQGEHTDRIQQFPAYIQSSRQEI